MVGPTTQPRPTDMHTLFRDFRNNMSWGRVCSAVALVVAVVGQFKTVKDVPLLDIGHLQLWLGVAIGSFGIAKLPEFASSFFKKTVIVDKQIASGGSDGCVGTSPQNPGGDT